MALEQLHGADLGREILVRVDTCGQTKALVSDCRDVGIDVRQSTAGQSTRGRVALGKLGAFLTGPVC